MDFLVSANRQGRKAPETDDEHANRMVALTRFNVSELHGAAM